MKRETIDASRSRALRACQTLGFRRTRDVYALVRCDFAMGEVDGYSYRHANAVWLQGLSGWMLDRRDAFALIVRAAYS